MSTIGALCASQSYEDRNTLVLGTEAGSVFRAMIIPDKRKFI